MSLPNPRWLAAALVLLAVPSAQAQLKIAYAPTDFSAFRETGETWRMITKETPQPMTFEPYQL